LPGNTARRTCLYTRWTRWGDTGIFARIRKDPASKAVPKTVVTDSIDLKARRMEDNL
jgi:hypothetical protein